ncbi:phosphotransferase [Actinobacillus vicugnae]|uniref:phosphotransferase n=1 Tax=Actinobacillus vicugnae TaxID=2573093 RepID=UPI0012411BFF|nr:phosphotransferase [Actinobacillus vicugnae]
MLTKADKQIIAREPNLPGLAVLLNQQALLAQLKTLPQFADAIKAQVQYLRYKPNTSCACTVKIEFDGHSSQYFYAKALSKARFDESWNHPKRQKLVLQNDPLSPFALMDQYILFMYPVHDRGIGNLKWLTSKKAQQNLLKQCILPNASESCLHFEVLRYKPERRLVARVRQDGKTIAVVRSSNSVDFSRIIIGATFSVAERHQKIYGIDGTTYTLVTSWQKGTSLCPEEGEFPSQELIPTIAKTIARIHQSPYKHPGKYDVADELNALNDVTNTFQHILPEAAHWLKTLIIELEQKLPKIIPHFTLIHGDLSLDQMIMRKNKEGRVKLRVLDWDRATSGNPLMDLATMQARLELQVIEGVIPQWKAKNLMTALLKAYQKRTQYDLDGLPYFVASAILKLATEPFRKRSAKWEQNCLQLLQRAEIILNQPSNPLTVHINAPTDISADPLLSTLTDHVAMQNMLMSTLPEDFQGELKSAVLKRYKKQRRALIDYAVNTENGLRYFIGKYRTKGLDNRAYKVQKALWNKGFKYEKTVSVARPLGKLPELHTWLQDKIDGLCLGELLHPNNQRLAFWGESVAKALHTLHQSNVAQELELPVWTVEKEMEILQDRLTQAESILPHLAERIAKVRCDSWEISRLISSQELVSVHRDFYQDQVLERNGHPGHLVLLDLDLMSQGHAALDAGNYLAHIQEYGLRQYGNINTFKVHMDAFEHSFIAQTHANAKDVNTYTALSLARHIYISTLFDDRKPITESLLKITEQNFKVLLN